MIVEEDEFSSDFLATESNQAVTTFCSKCTSLIDENAKLKAKVRQYSLALDQVLTGKKIKSTELMLTSATAPSSFLNTVNEVMHSTKDLDKHKSA